MHNFRQNNRQRGYVIFVKCPGTWQNPAKLEGDLGLSRETDNERAKKNYSKITLSTVSSPSKKKTPLVEIKINKKYKLCIDDTRASI